MKSITLDEIKAKAAPILKQADVQKASLFGSFARGEESDKSDIDILIEVPSSMSLFGFINLEHKLEKVLDKKVDLVDYSGIKPRIKHFIIKDQVSIL